MMWCRAQPRNMRQEETQGLHAYHGTWCDASGRRAGWSWAAETFSRNQSTSICSTSLSCFMSTFAVPFFSQVCVWSLWFIYLWKLLVQLVQFLWAAGADGDSAHSSLLHSTFLCLLTACFPIQSSRYFLICFIAEQVQCAKRGDSEGRQQQQAEFSSPTKLLQALR